MAACHTAATNGDTITVTAGSYSTSSTTTITKYVKIIAGGTVTVTDDVANTSDLLNITESTAGSTRLQGFSFVQGAVVGRHDNPHGVIVVNYASGGKPVLVTGNSYTVTSTGDFIVWQSNRGVIWSNAVTGEREPTNCTANSAFVRLQATSQPDSWTTPALFGSADTNGDTAVYIEANTLTNVGEVIDCNSYSRAVVRYNTFINGGILNHGDSSVSCRYMEVYNNTFTYDATPVAGCTSCGGGSTPANVNGWVTSRGGTLLIHDNVLPDITSGCWGDKSEITLRVDNLRRNVGAYACFTGGYSAPYQTGWGYTTGGTTTNSVPPVQQDVEPIYLWNNSGGGNYGSPSIADFPCNQPGGTGSCDYPDEAACALRPSATTFLQSGRDYFTATPKPGYAAFTYPHPLTCGHTDGTPCASAPGRHPRRGML